MAELRPEGSALLSVSTFAQAIDRPSRTVRYWCERGHISAKQTPGGHYQIPRSELDRVRAGLPREALAA